MLFNQNPIIFIEPPVLTRSPTRQNLLSASMPQASSIIIVFLRALKSRYYFRTSCHREAFHAVAISISIKQKDRLLRHFVPHKDKP